MSIGWSFIHLDEQWLWSVVTKSLIGWSHIAEWLGEIVGLTVVETVGVGSGSGCGRLVRVWVWQGAGEGPTASSDRTITRKNPTNAARRGQVPPLPSTDALPPLITTDHH